MRGYIWCPKGRRGNVASAGSLKGVEESKQTNPSCESLCDGLPYAESWRVQLLRNHRQAAKAELERALVRLRGHMKRSATRYCAPHDIRHALAPLQGTIHFCLSSLKQVGSTSRPGEVLLTHQIGNCCQTQHATG